MLRNNFPSKLLFFVLALGIINKVYAFDSLQAGAYSTKTGAYYSLKLESNSKVILTLSNAYTLAQGRKGYKIYDSSLKLIETTSSTLPEGEYIIFIEANGNDTMSVYSLALLPFSELPSIESAVYETKTGSYHSLVLENGGKVILTLSNAYTLAQGRKGYKIYDSSLKLIETTSSTLPEGEYIIFIEANGNDTMSVAIAHNPEATIVGSDEEATIVDSDEDGVADDVDLFPLNPLYALDNDNDSVPDEWEISRIGNLSSSDTSDGDNDGFTTLQEFIAGTDPLVMTVQSGFSQSDIDSAISDCANDPLSCGIDIGYTEEQLDEAILIAIAECSSDPVVCGISAGTASINHSMKSGWNLIGGKDASDTASIQSFISEHNANSVWHWNEQWYSYIKDTPEFLNSLITMDASKGYFVHVPAQE